MTIMLSGSDLTVTEVVAAARRGESVAFAPGAIQTMEQARAVVEEVLAKDRAGLRPQYRRRRAQVVPARSGRTPEVQPAPGAQPPHRPGGRGPLRRGPGRDGVPGQQLRQGRDRGPARAGRDDRHPAQRGLRAAGPPARLARPGRPRPDGRPGARAHHPQRLRGGRERGTGPGQQQRLHHRLGLPGPGRRADPDGHLRRGGRPGPGGVRRQPDQPAPGHRADPAVPRPGRHAGPAPRTARRQLPITPQGRPLPPGPADLPLPPADPRRGPRRARLRRETSSSSS